MAEIYDDILDHLAPCGLDCTRCVAFAGGAVRRLAAELDGALAGYESVAARMAGFVPVLTHYPEFESVLQFLKSGSCTGCRAGGSSVPFCSARTCFRDKGVDFCFQCDEFPCDRNEYPDSLGERWRAYGKRMGEIGPEAFYREQCARPRY
ncbi:DUF3795 domain-containing protein [Candidatus Fermentibacteria bacterium]|nr:DUF3795 domain-containing protein [Candidatus Fermentibacteria bacterium]